MKSGYRWHSCLWYHGTSYRCCPLCIPDVELTEEEAVLMNVDIKSMVVLITNPTYEDNIQSVPSQLLLGVTAETVDFILNLYHC